MNCTVCGEPHSKEAPLTNVTSLYREDALLCPACLEKMDATYANTIGLSLYGNKRSWGEPTGKIVFMDDAAFMAASQENARRIMEVFHIPPPITGAIE